MRFPFQRFKMETNKGDSQCRKGSNHPSSTDQLESGGSMFPILPQLDWIVTND